jgi:membrane-associated phospholipid phosphatase
VNGFDRGTTTRNSDTIDKISTGAAVAAAGWPVAAIFLGAGKSKGTLTDALVTGQAVVLNVALNQWIKLAVHRPRPFVYSLTDGNELLNENGSYYSFYSQHTSVAFAAGISYARTYALRHPTSGRRWLVYIAAIGGASAVGSMRVLAGRHFPTDVMTGAAAGVGMGLLVPWLHQKGTIPNLTAVPVPSGAAVSLRVPFGN